MANTSYKWESVMRACTTNGRPYSGGSQMRLLRRTVLATAAAVAVSSGIAQIAPAGTPPTPPANARRSVVRFDNGQLTVTATNASLNGILREVARSTGMKISGTVPEDRVFGTYGPADPQRVLATLLDGTGVNLMILSNQADKPLELLLTPRTGGATPPNPNAAQETAQDDSDEPPQGRAVDRESVNTRGFVSARPRAGVPDAPPANAPGHGGQPSEVTQPLVFPPIGATTAPATATTTPVDPDDSSDPSTETVKTPQQIFEQLQKLQQANPRTGTTGTGTATPP